MIDPSYLTRLVDEIVSTKLKAARQGATWWRVGDVKGNPGRSVIILRTSARAGYWRDMATGERGNLADLVARLEGIAA